MWKVFLSPLTTNLYSKDHVFQIVLHLHDGSIWAFGNEAQDLRAQEWSNQTVSAASASNLLLTLPENGPVLEIDSVGIQAWRQSMKTPQRSRGQEVCSQLRQNHNTQTTEWVSEPKSRSCQSGAHDWADDAHLWPAAQKKKKCQKQLVNVYLIIFYYSNQRLWMLSSSKYAGPSVSSHNDDTLQISLIKCQHYVQKDDKFTKLFTWFFSERANNKFKWTFKKKQILQFTTPLSELFLPAPEEGHWIFPANQ